MQKYVIFSIIENLKHLCCIMNDLLLECARVYQRQDRHIVILCSLCSSSPDLYIDFETFCKHFNALHDQSNDEELPNDDEEVTAPLATKEVTDDDIFDQYISEEEQAQSVSSDDLHSDELNVFNKPNRPFYSMLRTNSKLLHEFISLLRHHNCLWESKYQYADFKTNREGSACEISEKLAARWGISLLPQVICISARQLKRWFEEQFVEGIRNSGHKCRFPNYYEHLMQFLPTDHLHVLICNECDLRCKNESDLLQHKHKKHCGPSPHHCDICNKSFEQASKLRSHQIRYHNTDTPRWQCLQCVYNTPSKWDFRIHMISHNDARNYVCELCGSSFKTSTTLAVHKRTHEPPKLKCAYCQKKFYENYRLKCHVQKFHECNKI